MENEKHVAEHLLFCISYAVLNTESFFAFLLLFVKHTHTLFMTDVSCSYR